MSPTLDWPPRYYFSPVASITYLFSRGAIATKDSEARRRAEEFRQENAGWMRIFGLLLAAVMLVNIVLHLLEIFG